MSVLPKKLAFGSMKSRAKARSTRVSITPDSATSFNPGQNLTFRLPSAGQGVYIDTSSIALAFTIRNKKDKSFKLNSSASCFIARKVEAQTSVISDINEYGVLCEMIHDAQVSLDQRLHSMSITQGTSTTAHREGAQLVAASGSTYDELRVSTGLIGGLLAQGNSRYVPCGLSSPLTLQLVLQSAVRAVVWETGTTGVVDSDIDLVSWTLDYNTVELDAATNAALLASTGGVQRIMLDDFTHTQTSVPAGSTAHTPILPFQKSSLKSYFACMFNQDQTQSALAHSLNARTRSTVTGFQFSKDGMLMPQARPVSAAIGSNCGEFFNEWLGAFHITPGSLHTTSVYSADWIRNVATATGAGTPGAFTIAMNLDDYLGVNEQIFGGAQTIASTISPVITLAPGCVLMAVHHFGMFDSVVTINSMTGQIEVAA